MRQSNANPAIREGQILSALSYVDVLLPKLRLLGTAIPASAESSVTRFPAVYIDGDILSRTSSSDTSRYSEAIGFLSAELTNVPPLLLARAAQNAFAALSTANEKESGHADLKRCTFQLVKMLVHCDRPTLASDLVLRVVLDRPQSSSWHRQLLSQSFLRRLPASDAQDCISKFAKAIISRTRQQVPIKADSLEISQSEESAGRKAKMGDRPQAPVKVTTVKLLPHLLGDIAYLPAHFALSILPELVSGATHIDIRGAALNSLLDLLKCGTADQTESILGALEVIIPIPGNLGERRHVTDTEWAHAERTLELPDLDDEGTIAESAPMLWSLMTFLRDHPPGGPHFCAQAAFVTRIVLPIIESLKY